MNPVTLARLCFVGAVAAAILATAAWFANNFPLWCINAGLFLVLGILMKVNYRRVNVNGSVASMNGGNGGSGQPPR